MKYVDKIRDRHVRDTQDLTQRRYSWASTHDDSEHMNGELASAGACYALRTVPRLGDLAHDLWPWSDSWWKPKDRRRDLVRAGALIAAEIERLDRAATTKPAPSRCNCGWPYTTDGEHGDACPALTKDGRHE